MVTDFYVDSHPPNISRKIVCQGIQAASLSILHPWVGNEHLKYCYGLFRLMICLEVTTVTELHLKLMTSLSCANPELHLTLPPLHPRKEVLRWL